MIEIIIYINSFHSTPLPLKFRSCSGSQQMLLERLQDTVSSLQCWCSWFLLLTSFLTWFFRKCEVPPGQGSLFGGVRNSLTSYSETKWWQHVLLLCCKCFRVKMLMLRAAVRFSVLVFLYGNLGLSELQKAGYYFILVLQIQERKYFLISA